MLYDGLGELPHFNPDLEESEPVVVTELRRQIAAADGLLISSPEYAHGVPGALKNLLDWLVSGAEFTHKPVALFNASQYSTHGHAALAETVTVMSGRLIPGASITVPLRGTKLDEDGIVAHPEISRSIRDALAAFAGGIEREQAAAAAAAS